MSYSIETRQCAKLFVDNVDPRTLYDAAVGAHTNLVAGDGIGMVGGAATAGGSYFSAFMYGGYPRALAEIIARVHVLSSTSAKLYGTLTTSGSGTAYIGTSATSPGTDPRDMVANVYSGTGGSLDGLDVLKYVFFWGDIESWVPPEVEFTRVFRAYVTDVTYIA